MFGLSGAHRTGKTTLAKAVAERCGIIYHDASVSAIMKEIGYNPVTQSTLEERIVAQEHLLKRYVENLNDIKRPFITDRTPLDFIGYTVAELNMHSNVETGDRINRFVDNCIEATKQNFYGIVVCDILPEYEEDETKPPKNSGFQRHVQLIIDGALNSLNTKSIVRARIDEHDLSKRIKLVSGFVNDTIKIINSDFKDITIH